MLRVRNGIGKIPELNDPESIFAAFLRDLKKTKVQVRAIGNGKVPVIDPELFIRGGHLCQFLQGIEWVAKGSRQSDGCFQRVPEEGVQGLPDGIIAGFLNMPLNGQQGIFQK